MLAQLKRNGKYVEVFPNGDLNNLEFIDKHGNQYHISEFEVRMWEEKWMIKDDEQGSHIEQTLSTENIKEKFEELFAKNKDDKDNGTTVWLSKANKKRLDTLKFKSDGKYQLRPTVNAIIELFFENYKIE